MADFLLDALTRHQIWLQGLATHNANSFDQVLKRVDELIRAELSKTNEITTRKQLNEILKTVRAQVRAEYGDWTDELLDELTKLAAQESAFTVQALDKATTDAIDVKTPTAAILLAVLAARPIQTNDKGESTLLGPMLNSFTKGETDRVLGVIRNGYAKGLTNGQITQQIRGTKKNRFTDGILNTTRNNAQAIAVTGTNHAANSARLATMRTNDDLLKGWLFAATLDRNTTNICRFHDGEEYPIGEGPFPPLHIRCRSAGVPVVKDELSVFPAQKSSRASSGASGGAQTKKSPYYDWLATQPKWFQEEVLGKAKTDLFRNGGLTNEEFRKLTSDRFGEPLTLAEIAKRDPDAWRDAGLD